MLSAGSRGREEKHAVDRHPLGGKYGAGRFNVPADDGANPNILKRNRFFESQANSYIAIFLAKNLKIAGFPKHSWERWWGFQV